MSGFPVSNFETGIILYDWIFGNENDGDKISFKDEQLEVNSSCCYLHISELYEI